MFRQLMTLNFLDLFSGSFVYVQVMLTGSSESEIPSDVGSILGDSLVR